jgi:hypothetical protein
MPNFIDFDLNDHPDATDWIGDPIASDLEAGRSNFEEEQLAIMVREDAAIFFPEEESEYPF